MTSIPNNQCLIFARVSSKEQEETGYSLPAQEKLLSEYATRKNFKVNKVFEVAESASGSKERSIFNEMLSYLRKNKIEHLLCEKVDRITRNLKDATRINEWLDESENNKIHFVKQNLIIDKNSRSDEKFRWDIEIVLAKKYTANLSEEVKKGQKEKIAQGGYPNRPPLGYITIGEKGHKTHIPDPKNSLLVTKTFELFATGTYSISAIHKKMNEEGLRQADGAPVSRTRLHRYLQDPFYYGYFRWNGKINKGTHTPLISKTVYDRVQSHLSRGTASPVYQKHLYTFKGMVKCGECGGTISWYLKKGHHYGKCNHHKKCTQYKNYRQESLEEELFKKMTMMSPKSQAVIEWLKKALKASHQKEIEMKTQQKNSLNERSSMLDRREAILYDDRLDEKITPEFYKLKSEQIQNQKITINDELKKLEKDSQNYYEIGYTIHELALKSREIYLSAKTVVEDQRLLLSQLFSDHTITDVNIAINLTLAGEFLLKWMPLVNNNFEPQNLGSDKRKTDSFESANPVLLRGWDSNPRPIG